MILNDRDLSFWGATGGVKPFDARLINPASMDLRLGNLIREPNPVWKTFSAADLRRMIADETIRSIPYWGDPIEFAEYWLMPQGKGTSFVLCHSLEFVNLPANMAAFLFSKSSSGRRGIEHLHAGFGDPAWHDAQWTWELHNVAEWPIPLVAGQPLMQQVLVRLTEPPLRTYAETGRYNGQAGPTPERPPRE